METRDDTSREVVVELPFIGLSALGEEKDDFLNIVDGFQRRAGLTDEEMAELENGKIRLFYTNEMKLVAVAIEKEGIVIMLDWKDVITDEMEDAVIRKLDRDLIQVPYAHKRVARALRRDGYRIVTSLFMREGGI